MNNFLMQENQLPKEFSYPSSINKAVKLDLTNICPWSIMTQERAFIRLRGLQKRYPLRKLIPFAEKQDNDDIACFEVGKGEEVQIIHDFASLGWEQIGKRKFNDFWAWFKAAIDEMIVGEY